MPQVNARTNYYVLSAAGKQVGLCRHWLPRPTCAGSLVPCGCTAAASIRGSGVLLPARAAVKPPAKPIAEPAVQLPVRCATGHATCAAGAPGSVCLFWTAAAGKLPKCSGSVQRLCNCKAVHGLKMG